MSERMKILLAGMVAGNPHQGGASWAVLQYLAGLRSLGHEVVLVEPVPAGRLEPRGVVAKYFSSLSLPPGGAALLDTERRETLGLPFAELVAFADEADLLLNISGMLRDERLLEPIPIRAFLDLDPGFNQVWQVTGNEMGLDLHTHFVTVGLRLGMKDCPIPDCGRDWIRTLPPVALDLWPMEPESPRYNSFTTVGNWRSYGSVEHEGIRYGQRAHSLRRLIELPELTAARFQLALGIHPDETKDLEALKNNRWELLDPLDVAGSPESYASFVRGSKAELSVAKSGYVASGSGWFSDRSACYLASGRPVAAQETGFAGILPLGDGLLAFTTAGEAAEAVESIESCWDRHRRAARELAETYFDAKAVVGRLLDRID